LLISWKHELVGGVAFILAGLIYTILVLNDAVEWSLVLSWILIIAGPAFLVGILFFINWFKKNA